MLRVVGVLFLAALALAAPRADAADAIGLIDRIAGDCTGTVDGAPRPITGGDAVYLNETVATGPGARIEVVFNDGTRVTLGEKAALLLDAFLYDPAGQSRLSATVTGAFRYISGRLEGLATRQATVRTPVALIGVRGTDFWGGPFDGAYGVVVLDGAVDIQAGGVTTTVDQPGTGVDFAAPGAAAGPVAPWSAEKTAEALATVAFP
jgi:hypothetical protein